MVAWGSGVLGARRDGSSPIYFAHSMLAGIKWPLKGSVVASGDSAPKGGLAGCRDEAMGGDALRPFPFKLPLGNPNLYRAAMSLRVRCAPSVIPFPLARGAHRLVRFHPGCVGNRNQDRTQTRTRVRIRLFKKIG